MTVILSAALVTGALLFPQTPQEPQKSDAAESSSPQWMTDYAAAKAKAAEEGKDLLLDFTGSDWCIWCQRLDSEVFSKAEFQEAAPKHYILVKLDFPNDKSGQSEAEIAQNEKLMEEFGVGGFPTIFLVDQQGRPYAQTGYQEGGAPKYVEHLATLQQTKTKRDVAIAAADAAQGVDRAAQLANAIEVIDPELHRFYRPWIEEIVATGSPELKEKFQARLKKLDLDARLEKAQAEINKDAEAEDWDAAIAVVDRLLKADASELETPVHQQLLSVKGQLLVRKHDLQGAIAALEAAKALDPDGQIGQALGHMIEQVKATAAKPTPEGGDAPKDGADSGKQH